MWRTDKKKTTSFFARVMTSSNRMESNFARVFPYVDVLFCRNDFLNRIKICKYKKIHTIRKKYIASIFDQFFMDIYFIALVRVRGSTLDHEAQSLSQGWSEPSSLTSAKIWVPEQQGCNWGMQMIDGCSLKLCVGRVATLSVVSSGIEPHT